MKNIRNYVRKINYFHVILYLNDLSLYKQEEEKRWGKVKFNITTKYKLHFVYNNDLSGVNINVND